MQPIIEYFANNHDAIWYVAGGIMLVVEAKILGLSTGILLFTGIGAMLTGLAVSFGWAVETEVQIIIFGLTSVAVTALLWKPFKSLQKSDDTRDQSSDMIGMVVELTETAKRKSPGAVQWSGISWKAVLDKSCPEDSIEAGEEVKITAISAGKMTVTTND